MSRKRRSHSPSSKIAHAPARKRFEPDVPVSLLAGIGLLIAGALAFFADGAEEALFCGPESGSGMIAFECVAAEINGYPTWIINGRRFQQVLTVEELARYARFDPARASAGAAQ